jgi:hypothetical protein
VMLIIGEIQNGGGLARMYPVRKAGASPRELLERALAGGFAPEKKDLGRRYGSSERRLNHDFGLKHHCGDCVAPAQHSLEESVRLAGYSTIASGEP